MPHISVIIPVYKAENTLHELWRRLRSSLETITEDFEVILVEDCGGDHSWDIIHELSLADNRVKGIRFSRNFGQHNALLCGIRAAKYDVIVTIDDDLQHPPEEIPKLLEKLDEGYDVVYGTPIQMEHDFWRRITSNAAKLLMKWAMGVKDVSAFRAFRKEVTGAFSGYHDSYVSIDVFLSWATTGFSSVPVEHHKRASGSSGYTLRKLFIHALNMLTGYSTLPLKLASLAGFAFTIFGVFVLAYVFVGFFIHGSPVQGFPFLASIISIFAGAQLFALGIIGEYLARLHFRTLNKPLYLERESVGFETATKTKDKGE